MELTIKLDARNADAKALLLYLKAIAESNDYISIEKRKKKAAKKTNSLKGLTAKQKRKQEVLNDVREGMKQVRLHQQGKIKLKSAREVLDEL